MAVRGVGRPIARALASTCECVSTALRHAPLVEFQKRIMRSAVPPPDASRFFCHGHHASAFTAAWWASQRKSGVSFVAMFPVDDGAMYLRREA